MVVFPHVISAPSSTSRRRGLIFPGNLTGEESATFILFKTTIGQIGISRLRTRQWTVQWTRIQRPFQTPRKHRLALPSAHALLLSRRRENKRPVSLTAAHFSVPTRACFQISIEKQLHAGSIQFNTLVTPIGGIILHSAILSGRKLLPCSSSLCCIKAFSNEQTARTVNVSMLYRSDD